MLTFACWPKPAAQLLSSNTTTPLLCILVIAVTTSESNDSKDRLEFTQQYPDWLQRGPAAAVPWKSLGGSDEWTPLTCEKLFYLPAVKHVRVGSAEQPQPRQEWIKLRNVFTLLHRISNSAAGNQQLDQLFVGKKRLDLFFFCLMNRHREV